MRHVPSADIPWEPAPAEHFTGSVWFGPMAEPQSPDGLLVLGVSFAAAARTDWHHHPGGQVLHVTGGNGLVSNRAGVTIHMSVGDTVTIPPGEEHWHGATPDAPMTHLSLTSHGVTGWLPDKVTDSEYLRAAGDAADE